ncbi:protein translocase subunit SecF [Candidatus Woesearchaeota archaeon]|nr:protein translocase subunit SecF [Candidatus Woesearchaeota archaeon]
MSRRERKVLRRKGKKYKSDTQSDDIQDVKPRQERRKQNKFLDFYEKNYKKSMWITVVMLLISIIIIIGNTVITGEFIPRGVSLKGGVTITVPSDDLVDIDELQSYLRSQFTQSSIHVRSMTSAGEKIGFIVDASDVDSEELLDSIRDRTGGFEKFSMETMGSALGEAFFKQILLAILIAFALMSLVVFFAFKTFVPSAAVILSAVSDIIMTIAVIDLLQIRIETAGIAALLMLIGYSVDTDILLTTRVVKRTEGAVFDRVVGAMKTGMTMTVTSLAAVTVALVFTQSETLKQIMLILFIGLIFDMLNTWIQNAGILRWYMEGKSMKKAQATLAEYNIPTNEGVSQEKSVTQHNNTPKTHHKTHHKVPPKTYETEQTGEDKKSPGE